MLIEQSTPLYTESKEVLPLYPIPKRLNSDPIEITQLMKAIALRNQNEGSTILRDLLNINSISLEQDFLKKIIKI